MSDWEPKDRSTICSEHFRNEDFYETRCGLRKIKNGAVPVVAQLSEEDKLPQKLCWECTSRLLAAARFKGKVLRTHELLTGLPHANQYITIRDIRSINRRQNKLRSSLTHQYYDPNDYNIHIKDDQIIVKSEVKEFDDFDEKVPPIAEVELIKDEKNNTEFYDEFNDGNDYDDDAGFIEAPVEANDAVEANDSDDKVLSEVYVKKKRKLKKKVKVKKKEKIAEIQKRQETRVCPGSIEGKWHAGDKYPIPHCPAKIRNRIRNDSQSMNADKNGRLVRKVERRPVIHPRDPSDKGDMCDTGGPVSCEQVEALNYPVRRPIARLAFIRATLPTRASRQERTKLSAMKTPCMCEQCGRIFQSMALLKDHMWVHTGEKRFKCDRCDKSFTQKTNLVFHMRVHSATRPSYECPLCGNTLRSSIIGDGICL
ncbi:hypothetical protein MSG28_016206 [Choristoneura fumiferana]|uniref:Uncharacterized protein n=1 Tax=Choristoneura fumiferana TaxID=7141 RepID=A0ACC0K5W0_CHOFU|nr:hypothetical protein MSG28_016206 [Choristoneura fumiferana]